MVLPRRLATLESGLDPEAMIVHWLIEAQEFPSLLGYLASLDDGSDPLVDIPDRLETTAKTRMKGQPRHKTDDVVRRDVRDAIFRFHLVFALDEEAGRLTDHEGLRHAALVVWFRELTLRESLLDKGAKVAVLAEADRLPSAWGHWDAAITESLVGLQAARMARGRLERRYLGEQASLFSERDEAWEALVERVEGLLELGRGYEEQAGRHADGALATQETIAVAAEARADEVAHGIVVRAMYGAHQFVGDTREAERIATQQVRASVR